mmetsp:Transcript_46430/g.143832  ORF Transcript_46430/g.143832 Transcript_46430/m.143832 type:complete len:247 (+) Transcript_46430:1433-2173(+)
MSTLLPTMLYQSPPPARQLSQLKPCSSTVREGSGAEVIFRISSNRHMLCMRRCMTFSWSRSRSISSTSFWCFVHSWTSSMGSMSIMLGFLVISRFGVPSRLKTRWRLDLRLNPPGPGPPEPLCSPDFVLAGGTLSSGTVSSKVSPSSSIGSQLAPVSTRGMDDVETLVVGGGLDLLVLLPSTLELPASSCEWHWTSGLPQEQLAVSCTWPPTLFGKCRERLRPPSQVAAWGLLPSAGCTRILNSNF